MVTRRSMYCRGRSTSRRIEHRLPDWRELISVRIKPPHYADQLCMSCVCNTVLHSELLCYELQGGVYRSHGGALLCAMLIWTYQLHIMSAYPHRMSGRQPAMRSSHLMQNASVDQCSSSCCWPGLLLLCICQPQRTCNVQRLPHFPPQACGLSHKHKLPHC